MPVTQAGWRRHCHRARTACCCQHCCTLASSAVPAAGNNCIQLPHDIPCGSRRHPACVLPFPQVTPLTLCPPAPPSPTPPRDPHPCPPHASQDQIDDFSTLLEACLAHAVGLGFDIGEWVWSDVEGWKGIPCTCGMEGAGARGLQRAGEGCPWSTGAAQAVRPWHDMPARAAPRPGPSRQRARG